jgi:hypothetical protein
MTASRDPILADFPVPIRVSVDPCLLSMLRRLRLPPQHRPSSFSTTPRIARPLTRLLQPLRAAPSPAKKPFHTQ